MNKYKAKPVTLDGHRFGSQAEAARYRELKLLERAGEISELEVHPHYDLRVDGKPICVYEADFKYWDEDQLRYVTEDVKGLATPVYRLKKKLMLAIHGIEIMEIDAAALRGTASERKSK